MRTRSDGFENQHTFRHSATDGDEFIFVLFFPLISTKQRNRKFNPVSIARANLLANEKKKQRN